MTRIRRCSRKLWHTRFMRFMRGRILEFLASSRAPVFFSKALQYTVDTARNDEILFFFISLKKMIPGITSLSERDRLIYSTSLALKATCIYSLEDQIIR